MSTLRPHARLLAPLLAVLMLPGCSGWFFSASRRPDRSRPVVRIETRGGVEYGAATEYGLLFLGRTADQGPCRVHYFLGQQLLIEDGRIEPFGGVFKRARIDLKHTAADLWTDPIRPSDPLVALLIEGPQMVELPVTLANAPGVSGDVLAPTGRPLPIGTPLFVRGEDGRRYWFVGLVSGEATLERPDGGQVEHFVVFAGLECLREALEVPENSMAPVRIKYRPDGIWVETQDRRGADAPRSPVR